MNQPWGLSGPQFIGVYLSAFAVSLLCVVVLLAIVRRGPAADAAAVDVYTVAAVGSGGRRVVDTAVLALIEDGHLRASRDHKLRVCGDAVPAEPVQRAVLDVLRPGSGRTLEDARKLGAATHPVRRVIDLATGQGLLLTPARKRAARATVLLPAAVYGVGVARLVNGIRLGRPVGLLVGMLIVTAFVLLMVSAALPHRTRAGDRLLDRARREQDRNPGAHILGSYGSTGQLVPAAALSVALLGAVGLEDTALRTALFGSAASSGGSSGGGSSGCGGGGGCGGGCGGCGG